MIFQSEIHPKEREVVGDFSFFLKKNEFECCKLKKISKFAAINFEKKRINTYLEKIFTR